jgi:hypothetical protein
MAFIAELEPADFGALVAKAAEARREARIWDMYVAQLPYMDPKKRVSYAEFLASATGDKRPRQTNRAGLTAEQIDAKFSAIAERHKQARG